MGTVLLFVLIGGSYIIAERITKPIKLLQDAMVDLDHVKLPKYGVTYEVDELSKQYQKMLDKIQRLLSEIKENEQYLRNYELSALYSQINPHFLYNTLDTIVWMAEFNDSEKVIEVTKSLAQFFRISLSKGQEMITLESEIDHITQYLFIQKQRYEDQLNYTIELPEALKNLEVPKIILQPIVENAIYHGIKEQTEGGHILVRCSVENESLQIIVADDGVGFDMNQQTSNTLKLGGVGIENVKKRLNLVYGEASRFEINSVINQGTTIKIFIPLSHT